jgi:hypothetical protein
VVFLSTFDSGYVSIVLNWFMRNLLEYAFNRYSQNGEDGVIEELCSRLGIARGWFVEFGAWDGKHLSNTFNLLSRHGWQGVHIEGCEERYKDLLMLKDEFPGRLHTICAFIEIAGEKQLDKLLAATPLPRDFDLLSIDIDSWDAQIWESHREYRPKIVVVESNNKLPPGVLQLHSPPEHIGASFSSLVALGRSKGYQLVCHTGNCIFVANDLVGKLQIAPAFIESPEKLFNRAKHFREKWVDHGRKLLPKPVMNLAFKASNQWKKMRNRR